MDLLNPAAEPIDTTKALATVYKDLARPGVRQVGAALKNVLALFLFPFSDVPAHWVAIGRLALARNLERFREKLAKEDMTDVEQVPNEIAVPILEKLCYVEDSDIRELFLNLLCPFRNGAWGAVVRGLSSFILSDAEEDERWRWSRRGARG